VTHTTHVIKWAATAGATALLICSAVTPAAARPWPGDPAPSHAAQSAGHNVRTTATDDRNCPLRRIEKQLVRCGNLTGAGIGAAPWVPQL
jgi:hypothetical protein